MDQQQQQQQRWCQQHHQRRHQHPHQQHHHEFYYFYQGQQPVTKSKERRAWNATSATFRCKGRWDRLAWGPQWLGSTATASPLFVLILLVHLHLAVGTTVTGVTYQQCAAPPQVLVESTGTTVQAALALCIKTQKALVADLDNADSFFIGNSSNFRDFGAACYNIANVYNVVEDSDTYIYMRAPQLPPEFSQVSWDLSLWPKYDPGLKQKVNLTVTNFGGSYLQLTGIKYQDLGLPKDYKFGVGNVTTIEVEYSKVKLSYSTLPILEQYLLDTSVNELSAGVTALAFYQTPTDPKSSSITITYALVNYEPGKPDEEYTFLLYESTFSMEAAKTKAQGSGRRLLVAAPTNKAPAAACSAASCKPASPLPKTCKPKGGVKYPACLKKCSCFSK